MRAGVPRSTCHLLLAAIALLIASGCGRHETLTGATPAFVSPHAARVALGKTVHFKAPGFASPPTWSVVGEAGSGEIGRGGVYYAPLRAPTTRRLAITASDGGLVDSATVSLVDGPIGTLDCFALSQRTAPPHFGDYVYVEELPVAIVKVAPVYPDSARENNIEGQVMVQALVCACGEIADVRVVRSIPALDASAVAAVRQWIFHPGLVQGEPVACWIAVPVRFSLH